MCKVYSERRQELGDFTMTLTCECVQEVKPVHLVRSPLGRERNGHLQRGVRVRVHRQLFTTGVEVRRRKPLGEVGVESLDVPPSRSLEEVQWRSAPSDQPGKDDIHNLRRQMPNGANERRAPFAPRAALAATTCRSRVSHSFETLTHALGVHKPMVRERTD
jgi:hypothetical protein